MCEEKKDYMRPICERFVVTPATPEVAITVEQVYGKPLNCLIVPSKYVVTDFRKPKLNETFLDRGGKTPLNCYIVDQLSFGAGVRLILKKKEPRKVVKHVFTETGEIRRAHDGELYFIDGEVLKRYQSSTGGCYPILKYERIEEMVEE